MSYQPTNNRVNFASDLRDVLRQNDANRFARVKGTCPQVLHGEVFSIESPGEALALFAYSLSIKEDTAIAIISNNIDSPVLPLGLGT